MHPTRRRGLAVVRAVLPMLLVTAGVSGAGLARAAGVEDTVSGAIGLGRAANYARVNDFMATWQNPANLAIVPTTDLGGELRLPLFHACFDRYKDNSVEYRVDDPARGLAGSESFENVCNKGALMPTGNLGWAQAFDSGWGYGIGFFTPAATPTAEYGDPTIVTQGALMGEVNQTTPNGVESPNRFMLLKRDLLGGFLQAGVGAQPIKQLRAGSSVGLGFVSIHNVNVGSVQGGTFRDQEILTDVKATAWAIPRFTSSVVYSPLDSLDLMAAITYQGDVHAKGSVEFTTNGITNAPLTDCRAVKPALPGPHCKSDGAELTAPFPTLEATLALRYADRRNERIRALDPMKDEVWDVEVDGYFSQTSHVDQYTLKLYDQAPGSPGSTNLAFSSAPGAAVLSTPATLVIPRHWNDTFGVRLGGDFNVLPSKLAVRLGVSYETMAVPIAYMNIDSWPVAKVGLHGGATLAIEKYKFSVAYAHLFYQPVDVGVGQGKVNEVVSLNAAAAQAVNEGHYQAAQDIISVQANAAF